MDCIYNELCPGAKLDNHSSADAGRHSTSQPLPQMQEVDALINDVQVLAAINDPSFTDVFGRPLRMEAM